MGQTEVNVTADEERGERGSALTDCVALHTRLLAAAARLRRPARARIVLALLVSISSALAVLTPALAQGKGHSGEAGPDKVMIFGSSGAQTLFLDAAETGKTVGEEAFSNGQIHPILWNRHRLIDYSSLLGNESGFSAINNNDQETGFLTLSSGVEEAFRVSRGQLTILNVPDSIGNDINDQGTVVGGFKASDGTEHGYEWTFPKSDGPVFTDLGPGEAFGINVRGVTVGRNDAGDGTVFTDANGMPLLGQGRQPVDLGFPGTLLRINDYDFGVGHDDSQGGPKPIALNPFHLSTLRFLPVPSGDPFGSAMRVTDGGQIGGDAFATAGGSHPRPEFWAQFERAGHP